MVERCCFELGDTIDGKYRVQKLLGEGTFGHVYAVTDRSGRQWALKLLKLWEVPADIRGALVARFDMEFETGRIASPYLVQAYAHSIVGGNPYIVMEYCPGGDLGTYVSRHPRADYGRIALHVLSGLQALHQRGKVHRDLKPENVLVKEGGDFALTDFGISGDRNKRMTERNFMGQPKQIFGTYAYMPPEQFHPKRDATVLPTTDIFSFGVMMYKLLTGVLPFGPLVTERDLVQYMQRGKAGAWNRQQLSAHPEGCQWMSLIDGCLRPNLEERLSSATAVMQRIPTVGDLPAAAVETPAQDFQSRIVNGVLLRVMQGDEYGKTYRLDDLLRGSSSILSMGRQDPNVRNDISIREADSCYISRRRCTLELDYDRGTWVIRDGQWDKESTGGWRKSPNGTFVNSREVSPDGIPFSPGDIISIGDTKLRAEGY